MMMKVAAVLATVLALGTCHDTYTGGCPNFKATDTFDMEKFKGRWYAMEKFDTDSNCLTYDFEQNTFNDQWDVLQTSELDELKKVSLHNKVKYRGELSFPHSNRQADMIVRFPLSILGSASFRVLDTDHTNYAVVCTCQEQKFLFLFTMHRRSCTILQREPTKNREYSDKLHALVNEQFGDEDAAHDFEDISHKSCDYDDNEKGLQIDVDDILQTTKDQAVGTVFKIEDAFKDIFGEGKGEAGIVKEIDETLERDLPVEDQPPRV